MTAAWESFADANALRFGTRCLSGEPSISGSFGRQRIRVTVSPPGKGNSGYTHFRLEFYSPLPIDLSLTSETGQAKILKFLGKTDYEIGDSDFDEAVVVGGDSAAMVRQFLTEERRTNLLHLFQSSFRAKVSRSGLTYQVPGMANSELELEEGINVCVAVAKVLES